MSKALTFALVVLLAVACLQAQEGNPGSDVWARGYPPSISGCLANSGFHYTVMGDNGRVYDLTGDTGKLRPYIDHEVEITGQWRVRTLDTTVDGAASTVEEIAALDIRSVKELSKTCNATK